MCVKALQEVILEENGIRFAVRTECQGVCGKVFKAVGVAVPPNTWTRAIASRPYPVVIKGDYRKGELRELENFDIMNL